MIGMDLSKSSDQYQKWEEQMEVSMENNANLKLAVLEIGCGTRVPSVRKECQDVVADTCNRANDTTNPERFVHIRINPDEYEIEKNPGTTAIGIQGTALATLQAIDGYVTRRSSVENGS